MVMVMVIWLGLSARNGQHATQILITYQGHGVARCPVLADSTHAIQILRKRLPRLPVINLAKDQVAQIGLILPVPTTTKRKKNRKKSGCAGGACRGLCAVGRMVHAGAFCFYLAVMGVWGTVCGT